MKSFLQVKQNGFSLIELMIALLLGMILLLGVTQVMISSSSLGTTTNNLSVNQDRAKTVLDLLGSEAGRAGYNGCSAGGEIGWSGKNTDEHRKRSFAVVPLKTPVGVMFAYGIDEKFAQSGETQLTAEDCFGRKLYYRNMVYQNCGDTYPEDLCIQGRSVATSNNFDLVNDRIEGVRIEKIVLTLQNDTGEFSEVTIGTGGDTNYDDTNMSNLVNLQAAKLITFYINVKTAAGSGTEKHEAFTAVQRSYSATYRLRNL
ncbi:PilW family protein [Entomomonas asaccharolytica]|uniref:Prepilin-type N-terminal cleavage/methylation domain-containing protein n=1 Tax=Entomomonas asaccharolytica TaxID=2785331 RepID=A0A974NEJ0_9GAMM|nr:prepilin-type N-terminal cleavage/methylation domain-containing protein [Entomomonas asaccharolytica]QQP85154.1 prepilin-type N-terminal cleavage/methylation domain-containing protein [Entomomonas asaccharolytica]